MKHYNVKDVEKDNSDIATIFFVPKKVGEMMVGLYRHCGIIYDNKTYEILDGTPIKTSLPNLKKEKAEFLETKIYPEKIEQEINNNITSSEFVMRVLGMSNLKGQNSSCLQPSDIYKIIKKRRIAANNCSMK